MQIFGNAVLLVGLVVFLGFTSYEYSPAPLEEIKTVSVMAKDNQEAQEVLKQFLASTPDPTRSVLWDVEKKINSILVRSFSEEVTGTSVSPPQTAWDEVHSRYEETTSLQWLAIPTWQKRIEWLALKALPFMLVSVVVALCGQLFFSMVRYARPGIHG
ncbi:MAG: hypothetical protein ACD_74C00158G0005 [uncultured bacterium]|nr:MAG: hypothetical protein ACD_74C00158G0005 [uncultured bacterium]